MMGFSMSLGSLFLIIGHPPLDLQRREGHVGPGLERQVVTARSLGRRTHVGRCWVVATVSRQPW